MSLTAMLWVLNYSRTSGNERLALIAIADEANDQGEARPSHKAIARKARMHRVTVLRAIARVLKHHADELTAEIRDGRTTVYKLPLIDQKKGRRTGSDPLQVTGSDPLQVTGSDPLQVTGSDPLQGVQQIATGLTSVRTTILYNGPSSSPRSSAVEDFATWWADTFPSYNDGALSVPRPADVRLVDELLKRRPAWQLQNMAIAMWLVNRHDEPWIAKTDRSIAVLHHKADWLDLQLNHFPRWWFDCPHTPRCSTAEHCQTANP